MTKHKLVAVLGMAIKYGVTYTIELRFNTYFTESWILSADPHICDMKVG